MVAYDLKHPRGGDLTVACVRNRTPACYSVRGGTIRVHELPGASSDGVGVRRGTLSGWSDPELVTAARAGHDSAYEELYRRYRGRVIAFVEGIVGDRNCAEEIAQEAFVAAWQALRASDTEIAFKAWIYTIARNASLNARRRHARFEEISMSGAEPALPPADRLRLVSEAATPDDVVAAKESLEHLGGAFDELTDSHFRILVMRELDGLPYREIARRMGLTQGAVQVMLLRARRRLRTQYAEVASGARCTSASAAIDRMAEHRESGRDRRMVTRHLVRCVHCRRHARELGVAIEVPATVRARVAAVLGLPWLLRGRDSGAATGRYDAEALRQTLQGWMPVAAGPGADAATTLTKTAAILVVILLVGHGADRDRDVASAPGAGAAARPMVAATGDRDEALDRRGIGGDRGERRVRRTARPEAARRGSGRLPSDRATRGPRGTQPSGPRPRGTPSGAPDGTRLTLPLTPPGSTATEGTYTRGPISAPIPPLPSTGVPSDVVGDVYGEAAGRLRYGE